LVSRMPRDWAAEVKERRHFLIVEGFGERIPEITRAWE
jgi:hypothetical protein